MTNINAAPIGVFDSGAGGISVLKRLWALMPNEQYLYYGDSANAPYGVRPVEEIRALTVAAVEKLLSLGCKAIVLACNTATSAAAAELRAAYPDVPIIGLEPALKPAALSGNHPTVVVMATPLTLREEKFARLTERFEDVCTLIKLPAPELVTLVEENKMGTPELAAYLQALFEPLKGTKIDCLVLGCTHFPFAKREIRAVLGPRPVFFDGAVGEAKYAKVVLEERKLRAPADAVGGIRFESSDPQKIGLLQQLFAFDL
ncbi:MAG: glutamate racemase [Clostridia bacterium]|nr:glutamate racemase [Clostridia bacterium]